MGGCGVLAAAYAVAASGLRAVMLGRLEIFGDTDAVARISESLAALGCGEPGVEMATVRQDLTRRHVTGA